MGFLLADTFGYRPDRNATVEIAQRILGLRVLV
jgi:hypothetical protein